MSASRRQSGTSGIKVALIAAALVLLGFLGYALYTSYKSQDNRPVSTQADDVQAAPEISSPADLDKAEETIDTTELEANNTDDLEDIDKELSGF